MTTKTLIHYGEIALKGKNRKIFEDQLANNIRSTCGGKVSMFHGRMELDGGDADKLTSVFGIVWYARCNTIRGDYEAIEKTALLILKKEINNKTKTFALRIKRADKSFPLTSQQIAVKLGNTIGGRLNLSVDLDNPDIELFIEVSDTIYLFFNKQVGLGGLPVGVSGKVLVLFSGGMDSALSALMMAKRGCIVDMLHVHAFSSNEDTNLHKITDIIHYISPMTNTKKLYLLPYTHFQLSLSKECTGLEAVLFRRFLTRCGNMIAKKHNYKAIVFGDSVGQVASQTLDNLSLIDSDIGISLFRPLVGFDKQEIIDACRVYGIHDICSQSYKDCCSIISQSPKTKAKRFEIEKIERSMNTEEVTEETMKELNEVVKIDK